MERHFGLPITFAAALHAALFFGHIPRSVKGSASRANPSQVPDPQPTDVLVVEPLRAFSEDEGRLNQGGSQDAPPRLPDVPRPDAPGFRIPISIFSKLTSAAAARIAIPSRPFGIPGGAGIGRTVVNYDALDNPPRACVQIPPDYPVTARQNGITGEVTVEFVVDEAGRVRDAHAIRSTDRMFEAPAARAVGQWRFEPGRYHGRPVSFRMAVPIVFRLEAGRT